MNSHQNHENYRGSAGGWKAGAPGLVLWRSRRGHWAPSGSRPHSHGPCATTSNLTYHRTDVGDSDQHPLKSRFGQHAPFLEPSALGMLPSFCEGTPRALRDRALTEWGFFLWKAVSLITLNGYPVWARRACLSWVSVASRGHLECTSFQEPNRSDKSRLKYLR